MMAVYQILYYYLAEKLNVLCGEMAGASISGKQKGEGESMRNNLHCTDALPAFIIS
jgi:hypothetical protein